MSVNLYSLLGETIDTQHAKQASEQRSEVCNLPSFKLCLLFLLVPVVVAIEPYLKKMSGPNIALKSMFSVFDLLLCCVGEV